MFCVYVGVMIVYRRDKYNSLENLLSQLLALIILQRKECQESTLTFSQDTGQRNCK